MKYKAYKYQIVIFLSILCLFLFKCTPVEQSPYQNIKEYADKIKVIDTHEHQHWPEEYGELTYRFYHLLNATYLMQDVISAGGTRLDMESLDSLDLDSHWDINGKYLDECRNTSYYGHFVKGLQKHYDFSDKYFTKSNIHFLSSQIEKNYQDYHSWFDTAFHKAGFEVMFNDQYWKPFNVDLDDKYFALVFHINAIVYDICKRPAQNGNKVRTYGFAEKDGYNINSLEDYLNYCDYLFQKNIERNAVCVKNSMAYGRSLDYEVVSFKVAEKLYKKPSLQLSDSDKKQLEDFMFHWIIKKSIKYDLPIQIHTGYLAGDGNHLENGKPVKLNNLFLKYKDAKFVLFHGGYPWTSEFVAFGKMFPNVYLDLVWLPQISREKAVLTLNEILDCVPYNKIFWGGDCAFIEEATGSLEYAKGVLAEVLSERINKGLLTNDVAFKIVESILRKNAIELFKLNEKLGIDY